MERTELGVNVAGCDAWLGLAWAALSIVIDLPIFLAVFQMTLPDYAADIALTYVAFPAVTTGIALAQQRGRRT